MHAYKCQKTTTCEMSEFGAEMIACPWNQQHHNSGELIHLIGYFSLAETLLFSAHILGF